MSSQNLIKLPRILWDGQRWALELFKAFQPNILFTKKVYLGGLTLFVDSSSVHIIARAENSVCVWETVYCGTVFKKLEFKGKYTTLNEAVIGFEQNESREFLLRQGNDKKRKLL